MKRFKISFDDNNTTDLNHAMKQSNNNTPSFDRIVDRIQQHFEGDLAGKRIAVWGLATSPLSQQRISAESVAIIHWLIDNGATVAIHDDTVSEAAVRSTFGDAFGNEVFGNQVEFCSNQWEAASRSFAVIVGTTCKSYTYIDAGFLRWHVAETVVFDVNDCVELGSNPANTIQHITFNEDSVVDPCDLIRFPSTQKQTRRQSQWQEFRVAAAG